MPTNALLNPLVLPILGLLVEEPRHSYAVFAELRARHSHLQVRNGTVYTLIERLRAEGWIKYDESSAPAILGITRDGGKALGDSVRRELMDGDSTNGHAFTTALAYIGILDKEVARTLLSERAAVVRDKLARVHELLSETEAPPLHMIEAHYMSWKLAHDVEWLEKIVDDIDSGDLVWVRS